MVDNIAVFFLSLSWLIFSCSSRPANACGALRRVANKRVAGPNTCPGQTAQLAEEDDGVDMEVVFHAMLKVWNQSTETGDLGKSKKFFSFIHSGIDSI